MGRGLVRFVAEFLERGYGVVVGDMACVYELAKRVEDSDAHLVLDPEESALIARTEVLRDLLGIDVAPSTEALIVVVRSRDGECEYDAYIGRREEVIKRFKGVE